MALPTSSISEISNSPKKIPGRDHTNTENTGNIGTTVTTITTGKTGKTGTTVTTSKNQEQIVGDLLKIIESEYQKGNRTVTQEKYNAFLKLREAQLSTNKSQQTPEIPSRPALPAPLYPSIFHKFKVPEIKRVNKNKKPGLVNPQNTKWSFKSVETALISALEAVASILDNLHLISKMPMFPKSLAKLLTHTNRIWVIILIFLIRKTIAQLLNVRRKERRIKSELGILRSRCNHTLQQQAYKSEDSLLCKYEKALQDLKFDKNMLRIELLGNLLDLAFNVIELYNVYVPRWIMGTLNFASMAMTIYRMNKDDEHLDDESNENLI